MIGDSSAAAAAVIARCRTCQGITFASVVDESRGLQLDKTEITELVTAGYNIEHVTVGYVRTAKFCVCDRPRRARKAARRQAGAA